MSYRAKSGKLIVDLPTPEEIQDASREQLVVWKRTIRCSYCKEDIITKMLINIRLKEQGSITIEEAEKFGVGFARQVIRRKRAQGKI